MEDDKKKRKKNKKKKNKQANEPTESDKLDAKELTSDSQNHDQEIGQSSNGEVSEIVDAPNTRWHITPDGDGDLANGNEVMHLAEEEKQHWLDREATLESKIKELQAEKDVQIQKEAFLEERIKQLMKENDGNSEKEASQNEKNKQLHDEKNVCLQNEARLKERLLELEKENDALIQKEGSLEQKIQQLQREMEAQMQKEGSLEQTIQHLQREMDDQLQKEGSLEQKIQHLQREMDAQLQKEGSLEQKIQHLQMEMDAQMQKEASLEKEILELKGENNSWVQKEDGFEPKFNQMVDEASLLNLKLVSLEENVKHMERERDSWILKENSAKESITSLTIDNTKLRAQVVELELSREMLFSEIQQLKEFISSQQLRINNLEIDKNVTIENGHSNSEVEAARALVERLMAENSELAEKVNELHAELEQSRVRTGQFPSNGSVPGAATARSAEIAGATAPMPDQASGSSKMILVSDSIQSLEDVMVKDERNGELVNVNRGLRAASSSEITEADAIVQIPLDENEVNESNQEVASQSDDDVDVLLTDSPLIGAPFRIISFVARYVSGADLVHKK